MRYFFHLQDGVCIRDEDGEVLADDAAAVAIGKKVAQDLGRNNPLANEWNIAVRDETGRVVATIPCADGGS